LPFPADTVFVPDPTRAFDRRVAVALGVMLDTGERR